ncbi:hypothetical protein SUGI_0327670 [Cryptomeria japonica]|nr:hypothetical protein SUGI_0327670 [Cryptomeria japonica]
MSNTYVNRDTLVGNLSSFEIEEFGPPGAIKIESIFHASTSSTRKIDWKVLYAKELEDMKKEDEEFEQLEALFSIIVPKGSIGSMYEGKSTFKCFAYEEGVTNDFDDELTQDSDSRSGNGKEWVFLTIKEDALEPVIQKEEKALAAKVEDKDGWVIVSGCSHHMTGDKRNFLSLQEFDGVLVRFGDDKECIIRGRGSISLDGKHNTDNVYFVEGLRHNLLSVGKLVDKGFQLHFKDGK